MGCALDVNMQARITHRAPEVKQEGRTAYSRSAPKGQSESSRLGIYGSAMSLHCIFRRYKGFPGSFLAAATLKTPQTAPNRLEAKILMKTKTIPGQPSGGTLSFVILVMLITSSSKHTGHDPNAYPYTVFRTTNSRKTNPVRGLVVAML